MYILTNINIGKDEAVILDTDDNSNDRVSLTLVVKDILKGRYKVFGLKKLNTTIKAPTVQPLPLVNESEIRKDLKLNENTKIPLIGLDIIEAKQALATHYINKGMTREQAMRQAGLIK